MARVEQLESRHLLTAMAEPDVYGTLKDHALTTNTPGVLSNDSSTFDLPGQPFPLNASLVSDVSHGVLTLNPDGSFTYTPNSGFEGDDTFEYEANEDFNPPSHAVATVTIHVGVRAFDDTLTTPENTELLLFATPDGFGFHAFDGVLTNDFPQGKIHAVIPFGNPLFGQTQTVNEGVGQTAIKYIPPLDYTGPDSFQYSIQGDDGEVSTATVHVTVTGPHAADDNYFTPEETTLTVDAAHSILNNDSTPDQVTPMVVEPPLHGQLTLNPDGTFVYVPDKNYNGQDGFRYRNDHGATLGDNVATVRINVNGIANAGGTYSIGETDSLQLDGSGTTGSSGGNLVYLWDVDPNVSNLDPFAFHSTFQPNFSNAFSGGSSPTLTLTWSQLNSVGITDGNPNGPRAIITLKVLNYNHLDAHGDPQESVSYAYLDISNIAPIVTSLTMEPADSGGCSGSSVTLSGSFMDPNPLDTSFSVYVDWNWDLLNGESTPSRDQQLGFTANGDGTFTIAPTTHSYSAGTYLPALIIDGPPGEQMPFALLTNATSFFGLPFVAVSGAGTPISVDSPSPATVYSWSVTIENGDPVTLPAGTVTDQATFTFTPATAGLYVVTVTADGVPSSQSYLVTGGTAVHAHILGAPTSNVLPTLAIDLSNGGGACGAVTYAWSVTKDGSPFATGSNSTFSFTPDNVGTYVVSLTVSGATSDSDTKTINVVRSISDGTTFMVGESNAADNVVIHASDIPAGTQKVVIYAGDGNDDIQVPGSLSIPVWIYGGPGNDRIKGGAGNDVIIGGDGDDLLMGGSGRDLLIGGNGQDRIIGDTDDDILIAGWTDFDNDPATLSLIMAEWTSPTDSFVIRCIALNGVLQNDGPNPTVHDDNNQDTLTGSSGTDWYFANLFLDNGDDADTRDRITDLSLLELLFVQDIDFIETDVT